MWRPLRTLLVFAVLLIPVVTVTANHSQTTSGKSAVFDHKEASANEWWVEVVVTGSSAATIQSVQAMDTGGPWTAMAYRADWGSWTASFRIEPGNQVRFRATWSDGAIIESCWFTHPQGVEQCATTPTPTTSPTTTTAAPPTTTREAETFRVRTTGAQQALTSASGGAFWNLWSNGHVEDTFSTTSSMNLVVIARGTPMGGVWPTMVVSIDGAVVGTTSVAMGTFTSFSAGAFPSGTHTVRIAFTNDQMSTTEDRNLHVDVVRLVPITTPTPTPTTSSPSPTPTTTTPTPTPTTNPTPFVSKEAEAFVTKTAGGRQTATTTSGGAFWNLWSNGYLQDSVTGDGTNTLVVVARGTPLGGVWPTMVLSVDGAVVRTHTVSSTTWTAYTIGVVPTGTHTLRIAFTNDAASSTEDRNLLLDVVRSTSAQAADASVTVASIDGGVIDPRVYSFNIASWEPADYIGPNATFVNMLRQLDPALLRFPPGHDGQHMYFDPTNTLTYPPAGYSRLLRGDTLDKFVAMARQVGAEPMIEINVKTGTPEMAASLVRYANVQRGHGIVWFEIGNEPDLSDAYRTNPTAEGEKFLRFEAAMRAVDPNIKLVGGAIMSGANAFGTNGRTAWLPPFSQVVTNHAQALSWHWYPLDSEQLSTSSSAYPSVAHLLQETANDWQTSGMDFAERACAGMAPLTRSTGAEHWITEIGPDSGAKQAPGITNGQVAAVWIADALPRLAECGATAVFQFAVRQQPGSVLVLMTHDRQPTPQWGTYQLLAQAYTGSWRDAAVTGPKELAAHAARQADGTVSLVLANKGATPLRVSVAMPGVTDVHTWTLEADGPTSVQSRVNGKILDRSAVLAGFAPIDASLSRPVEVPPYGVVVLSSK